MADPTDLSKLSDEEFDALYAKLAAQSGSTPPVIANNTGGGDFGLGGLGKAAASGLVHGVGAGVAGAPGDLLGLANETAGWLKGLVGSSGDSKDLGPAPPKPLEKMTDAELADYEEFVRSYGKGPKQFTIFRHRGYSNITGCE